MVFSHRWMGYLTILLQSIICSLLIYALIIESGDIVVSGCQKIGFYNFCFYSKTIEDCQCITQLKDLSLARRTNQHKFILAIILTYSPLVIVIMGILTMTLAQCFDEEILWKSSLWMNALSLFGLTLGMITYVFLTWDLFDISQVTPGFLAILTAMGGLTILWFIIRHNANLASGMLEVKTGRAFSLANL